MLVQTFIVLVIVCLAGGFFLYFQNKNQKSVKAHLQQLNLLEQHIYTNKNQISIRNKGLQQYNFLKYNLNEALIVQKEISI